MIDSVPSQDCCGLRAWSKRDDCLREVVFSAKHTGQRLIGNTLEKYRREQRSGRVDVAKKVDYGIYKGGVRGVSI